ncbi:MAG: hypothetical protein J6A83_05840 [Clostridia bacterium]|nr:hypothetical protein [Clostridia bacterium]
MKEKKNLITLFGTYSAILLATAIIGIIVLLTRLPSGTDDTPETVIETEYIYVWVDVPATSTGTSSDDRIWIVKEYNGVIGVFSEDGKLEQSIHVYVKTLPEADRNMLREGIRVTSERKLRELIEDYSS